MLIFSETPPAAPVLLTGQAVSSSSVALSWQNTDPRAVRFQVNRATVNGVFTRVADEVIGESYVDSGLANGQIYLYVVLAMSGLNVPSEESNAVAVSLDFKTAFVAKLNEEETGLTGFGVVQMIRAFDFADPANPANLGNVAGTIFRLTLRGSKRNVVRIDRLFVSQRARPFVEGSGTRLWDSATDLTLVASHVSVPADGILKLDAIVYVLDPTKDLLIAFDVQEGDLRSARVPGAVAYLRPATAEASIQGRSPDYESRPDRAYLIERIEIL